MNDGNLAGKADIQDFIKLALLILTHCDQTFNFTHGGWYAWSGLELHKYENKPDSSDVDKMKGDLRCIFVNVSLRLLVSRGWLIIWRM